MGTAVRMRWIALPRAALALLAEHGRARLEEDGRRRFVMVNPALYAG